MKKMYFSFFSLIIAAVFLQGENCTKIKTVASENAKQIDGPYVLYKDGKVFTKYILEEDGWKDIDQVTAHIRLA